MISNDNIEIHKEKMELLFQLNRHESTVELVAKSILQIKEIYKNPSYDGKVLLRARIVL